MVSFVCRCRSGGVVVEFVPSHFGRSFHHKGKRDGRSREKRQTRDVTVAEKQCDKGSGQPSEPLREDLPRNCPW